MPIIRAVDGIVEIHPGLPVSPRQPATQAGDGHRRNREEQERQAARSVLVKQAYGQPAYPGSEQKKPALLAQDLMTSPVTWLPSNSTLLEAWIVMTCKGIHHLPLT